MRLPRCIFQMLGGLVPFALFAALPTPSAAQDPGAHAPHGTMLAPYRYRVLGVFDAASGRPIADAGVTDLLTGAAAQTTQTGTVALSFLPEGGALVRIRKLGYAMETLAVAISPADTIPITVILHPVVQLPEVVTTGRARYISPNLRGFEARRRIGATGYFITDSVLRQEENRPLGNVLLSHVPGMNIADGQHGSMYLLRSPRCTDGGPPDVYLDGVLLVHPSPPPKPGQKRSRVRRGSEPVDLSQFEVTTLAGVEYYPDQTVAPTEYAATSKGCGVLLLWTREK